MSDAIYERYKEALRRGHVAAAAGRHAGAIAAYAEAAEIAPDRAPPLVGLARALAASGRRDDALAAYDAALDRDPSERHALGARAELLLERGDRIGAAESLDRLAVVLDGEGRTVDAITTALRALDLAESRARREDVGNLVSRLRSSASSPAELAIVEQADAALRSTELLEPGPEPIDPVAGTVEIEAAVAAGDDAAARSLAVRVAAAHRAAGHPAAAIDACYLALPANPVDPDLHLTLAELYLDRGWRSTAVEKLALLGRLADLGDDQETRARLCRIVAARLPDEGVLTERCA